MQMSRWLTALALGVALTFTGAGRAETKVELKGVHLCCGGCAKAVGGILSKIEGVKGACDKSAKTVTITADDDKAAAKAIAALAAGGFHGEIDNKELAMKDDSGVKKGKVETLTLTGAHNCCGSCCASIKATLKKVDGVKGDTAKPKSDTFTVTGDFDAAMVVKALNDAGFHVKVKE